MNTKKNALLCVLVFAIGTMAFTSCEKTIDTNQQLELSKKKSQGILYYCHWKSENGKDLLVEFRIDDKTVTEILIDGKPSAILECKTVVIYHERADALQAFSNCIEAGYECVRVDRLDISPAANIHGDYPTSNWSVIYGHPDENGNCNWEALSSILNED